MRTREFGHEILRSRGNALKILMLLGLFMALGACLGLEGDEDGIGHQQPLACESSDACTDGQACVEGVCVASACEGESPAAGGIACEANDDCAKGQVCSAEATGCVPSQCSCDESGHWVCTADCMLIRVCEPAGGEVLGCSDDDDCAHGQQCRHSTNECVDADECVAAPGCFSSQDCSAGEICQIDDGCHASYCNTCSGLCTDDCQPGFCAPATGDECAQDSDCPTWHMCLSGVCEGIACTMEYDPVCGVDGQTYGNACSAAAERVEVAHAGECQDDSSACQGPNPAGCTQLGCEDGQTCKTDADACAPSTCGCDEDTGHWICTMDCGGGGVCVDETEPSECDQDRDCPVWNLCIDNECLEIACTMQYDPVCGVDGQTYGNSCEAAANHVDVAYEGECE